MTRLSILMRFVLISLWIILGGCGGSPASRFYVLSPMPASDDNVQVKTDNGCYGIGVGPVTLPNYTDRPEIVTTISANKVSLGEFDRWAEPLIDGFPRILMENLSTLLCTDPITIYPLRGPTPIDYRVEVEVIRFDGTLGESASLIARWIIIDEKESSILLTRKSNLSSPVPAGGYEALVSAQSQNIAALSREIAEGIKTLISNKGY
jgi:uncharacterized lipoprotein YmbA